MTILTAHTAAQIAGISHDEALSVQTLPAALLLAAARGELDLNALARGEMVARGIGAEGRWVGFNAAATAWA
jgi:hypothetical protein